LISAAAAMAAIVPPLHAFKSMATRGTEPSGCCVPAKEFTLTQIDVAASWDVHGENAGYMYATFQVDQTNMLLWVGQFRATPSPKFFGLDLWITPGALQGQWFEFIKIHGASDCYVRNFTTKPDIFQPICYGPPYTYAGDVTVGTHPVSIWEEHGHNYNETHFVQMDACLPQFSLGFGINPSGDWEERLSNLFNIQFKIVDPSKFIPPTQCKPLAEASEETRTAVTTSMARRHYEA